MASSNYHKLLPSSSSSSSSSSYIPLHKTQLPPKLQTYPFYVNQKSHKHNQKNKKLVIIISLSILPFILYFISLYNSISILPSSSFGLIIDISKFHSKIIVFRSLNEVSGTPFSGESSESYLVDVGMFNFTKQGDEFVGNVLLRLVSFGKEKVPSFEWKDSKVMVFLSGYLIGDGLESERVLEICRKVLGSSGFLFRDDWASILNDQDEVFYSWLAVNYAFGYLGNKPQETAGLVSLGRSSIQISFASSETSGSHSTRIIRFGGVPYSLYTESVKQFSQDSILRSFHEHNTQDMMSSSLKSDKSIPNPCYPRGYKMISRVHDEKLVNFHGTGNFSACKSELTMLLNGRKGICTRPPCKIVPSIFSELENKPHPQQKFFLSSQLKGLIPKASISNLESDAHHFCEDDWETLKSQHIKDDSDLSRSCFSHAIMVILLSNDFGIPFDSKRVEFTAGSTPVDWRLGAFISQTIMDPFDNRTEHHDAHIVENESVTLLFLVVVILVFVLTTAFFVMKLRKPQFKTIYDLEQGRYIVSRVSR